MYYQRYRGKKLRLVSNIKSVSASNDLLNILNITIDDLVKLLSKNNYLSFKLKKANNKIRWIDSPNDELKKIQKIILNNILYKLKAHDSAHGFIKGKNPLSGAKVHFANKSKVFIMVDIKDYFPSVSYDQIIKVFYKVLHTLNIKHNKKLDVKNDAIVLTELCSHFNTLPQGAPTSPALANLVSYNMDVVLNDQSKSKGFLYTRYADDLCFSTIDRNISSTDVDNFLISIKYTLHNNGFELNNDKTRVVRPHKRQSITGVVVNDKLSVAKKYYQNTKAGVYNVQKLSTNTSAKQLQKLRGRIEWIRSIDKVKGDNLLNDLNNNIIKLKNYKKQIKINSTKIRTNAKKSNRVIS